MLANLGVEKQLFQKLLLNALTKYEGEILLNGYNINSIKREAIDHIFTIVTQVPMAISGTIRDNIDISMIYQMMKFILVLKRQN